MTTKTKKEALALLIDVLWDLDPDDIVRLESGFDYWEVQDAREQLAEHLDLCDDMLRIVS